MYLDRQSRHGAIACCVVVLVCIAVKVFFCTRETKIRIARDPLADSLAAAKREARRLSPDAVFVNYDSPRSLRKAGFSYYHISQMMYLRSLGYAYTGADQLLMLPYADTALICDIRGRLNFSHPDTALSVDELAYLVRQRWGRRTSSADWRKEDGGDASVRAERRYSPRVPFFAADSVAMAEAGMTAATWDTLALYQRSFVLHGSMSLDSLVALSPSALADVLRGKATPRRGQQRVDENVLTKKTYSIVELNSATREDLIALPGIGERTADAIVELRTQLGGFVDVRQLLGTWPLTQARYDGVKEYLRVDNSAVRKINVNSANDTRMRRHPYFSSLLVARIGQLRVRANGRKLDRGDIEKCVEGLEVSEFFWDYVGY